jgi:hypothetical protein
VNDGCPLIADEAAEDCGTEATDNDGDGAINDGCSAIAIVGTREECAAVNRNDVLDADEDLSPDTIDVDVTIADIPTTRPAISYSYNLSYDPLAMQIINVDSANLLAASAGSSIILAGDFLPDTDGLYFGATADSTVGAAEWGSGALDTLSIEVLDGPAAGGYDLQVYDAAHQDHYSRSMPTAAVNGAWVAVDVTCASLGAAPPPDPVKEGDVDCSNTITPIDALKILRFFAGLAVVQTDPCTDIGVSTTANATAPNPIHIGDVDCSGAVNAVDALKILRFAAGLSVTYIGTCDPLTP